jgi:hypothetical protein
VGVAQRAIGAVVARFVHTEEVTGSNPVSPTSQRLVPVCQTTPSGPVSDQLSDYAPEPPCPKSRSMTVAPVWMTGRI